MLDNTDKKVLAALFADARKPLSAISRANGLTREIVEYRMTTLVQKKVISAFVTRINQKYFCAGVAQVRVKLLRADNERFERIIEAVANHPSVNWAAELCGDADLIMTILYLNSEDLAKITGELLASMGDLVREQDVALYTKEHKYNMLGLVKPDEVSTAPPVTFSGQEHISLDDKDFIILHELAHNCRATIVALARSTKLSEDTVRQRIHSLEKNNVINGYTILLDAAACNYELYYLRFLVEQFTPEISSKFNYYVWTNPYITFCCETVGNYNIVLTIAAQNHKHFLDILLDIRKHFGTLLTDYEFQIIVRELKVVYVPTRLLQVERGKERVKNK